MVIASQVFRAHGWLSRVPDDFREAVLERCLPKSFEAGETIYRIGDPPTGMYGVCSGLVGMEVAPAEREPQLTFMGAPGAWVGFGAVVSRKTRLVTAVARRDSHLAFLPVQAIDEIIQGDPPRWRHFAQIGLGELKKAATLCDDLMRRDHVERVIAILLHFGGCRLRSAGDVDMLEVASSQDEIARVANVGRTAVGAVLRQLEADGLIKLAYRHICIVSSAALRARLIAREEPVRPAQRMASGHPTLTSSSRGARGGALAWTKP